MTLRFLLGVAECGAFPGVTLDACPQLLNLRLITLCLVKLVIVSGQHAYDQR